MKMEPEVLKLTPYGRMNMVLNEFYFKPKFSLNFLPYAEDGMFIEDELDVLFKFDPYKKKWALRGISGPSLERVYVNEETLKGITTQGLLRINLAIDYIFDRKDFANYILDKTEEK
jgi:hypothetical protein|tara:strand:+ start:1030 stop:1377 length:348 start_codon:yes stop_codon:yes gene_type:complete